MTVRAQHAHSHMHACVHTHTQKICRTLLSRYCTAQTYTLTTYVRTSAQRSISSHCTPILTCIPYTVHCTHCTLYTVHCTPYIHHTPYTVHCTHCTLYTVHHTYTIHCTLYNTPTRVLQAKTTLVLLSEDGSLRIYLASNNTETKYWVQPQFQASSPLAALQPRGRRRVKEGEWAGQQRGNGRGASFTPTSCVRVYTASSEHCHLSLSHTPLSCPCSLVQVRRESTSSFPLISLNTVCP